MKKIELQRRNFLALVDDEDFERLNIHTWQMTRTGHVIRQWRVPGGNGKRACEFLHHAIIGKPKSGFVTDHIDRNPLNNQKSNLRFCTQKQNLVNSDARNETGFKGVRRVQQKPSKKGKSLPPKWTAFCNNKYLGIFKTPEEAAKAYDEKVFSVYGEFAKLNFPLDTAKQ